VGARVARLGDSRGIERSPFFLCQRSPQTAHLGSVPHFVQAPVIVLDELLKLITRSRGTAGGSMRVAASGYAAVPHWEDKVE
jgi:hypothetical protein